MLRRYEDVQVKSSRRRAGPRRLPPFLLSVLAALLAAPAAFALPPAAPRAVRVDMRTVASGGLKWVRSSTEVVAVFPIPLEAYKTVLLDSASYVDFVPHLAAVDHFTTADGVPAMRQRFEVKILGFAFTSIFATTIEPDDSGLPRAWRLAWHFVDSDGSVGTTNGSWYLEDVSEGGESRVLVRHVNDGLVKKKYPFQLTVMRMVGERELCASVLDGYHEALRRWPEYKAAAAKNAQVEAIPGYRKSDDAID